MLKPGFQQLIEWFRRHPGESLLVSLHDNEISPSHRSRIQAHLKQCPRCQDRLAQIEQDWKKLGELRSAASEDPLSEMEMVSGIQAAIHEWRETNQPASSSRKSLTLTQAETDRQIAAVLGVYLGRRAADALLKANRTAQYSNQEILANAQSALRILIGRKGATAIEMKLHRIISRMQESAGGSSVS
jgi:anti-sigma factor RsiW